MHYVNARTTLVGALALAMPIVLAAGADAGVKLRLRSEPLGGGEGKTQSYEVWLDGPRLAIELVQRKEATKRRIVFRGGEDKVWLIDDAKQTYFQLDPESAKSMASQVAGLRQGLNQGLESLTPEQRAAVQDLIGELSKPPAGPPPEYKLRERGELGRYAEVACSRHDVLDGEKTVAEVCLADYGKPPLTRESFAAIPALGSFSRKTLEPLAAQFPSLSAVAPYAALDSVQGVPLSVKSTEDGKTRETFVKSIEPTAIDPKLFELPAGYARSWIPPFR
jgi:hypothetical protein